MMWLWILWPVVVGLSYYLFFTLLLPPFPLSLLGDGYEGGRWPRVWTFDPARCQFHPLATVTGVGLSLLPLFWTLPPLVALVIFTATCIWLLAAPRPTAAGAPPRSVTYRSPQWPSRVHKFRSVWRCAVGKAADDANIQLPGSATGRTVWRASSSAETFTFDPAQNPNAADIPYRTSRIADWRSKGGPAPSDDPVTTPLEAAQKGSAYWAQLQSPEGNWAGDYAGPHFLLPALAIVWYVTGRCPRLLSPAQRAAAAHYLKVHQQTDGGWGLHVQASSSLFGTVLCAAALRVLIVGGEDCSAHSPSDGPCQAAVSSDGPSAPTDEEVAAALERAGVFVRAHGGAASAPPWAVFFLCILGVLPWSAHAPLPPELLALPLAVPFHPLRMWCHARVVYIPMAYIWGYKFVLPRAASDPVVRDLRAALGVQGPCKPVTMLDEADVDTVFPVGGAVRLANSTVHLAERLAPGLMRRWREAGLRASRRLIAGDDVMTNFVSLGPVNKVLHVLCVYIDNPATGCSTHRDTPTGFRVPVGGLQTVEDAAAPMPRPTSALGAVFLPDEGTAAEAAQIRGCSSAVAMARHAARIQDYLWVAEDGLKMNGYNGAMLWDTAFAAQALAALDAANHGIRSGSRGDVKLSQVGVAKSGDDTCDSLHEVDAAFLPKEAASADVVKFSMHHAGRYVLATQIFRTSTARESPAYALEQPAGRLVYNRHQSEGGWPFSTSAHGWPVSDCTGEGLSAMCDIARQIPDSASAAAVANAGVLRPRAATCVDLLITMQNPDGGWPTYEPCRGWGWYEALNPSRAFGGIMVDYSYVECTGSVLTALAKARSVAPRHRRQDLTATIGRGTRYLLHTQRPDGCWPGAWGNCTIYGTWFAVRALVTIFGTHPTSGIRSPLIASANSEGCIAPGTSTRTNMFVPPQEVAESIGRAVRFLVERQLPNGGWGESFQAAVDTAFVPSDAPWDHEGAHSVSTAWAVLTLTAAVNLGVLADGDAVWRELPRGGRSEKKQCSAQNEDAPADFASGTNGSDMQSSEASSVSQEVHLVDAWRAAQRGAQYLVSRQLPDGDWPCEGVLGVFNRTCSITYASYRNVFPIWALADVAALQKAREAARHVSSLGGSVGSSPTTPSPTSSQPNDAETRSDTDKPKMDESAASNESGPGSHNQFVALAVGAVAVIAAAWGLAPDNWPDPTGLLYGLLWVLIGQAGVLTYYAAQNAGFLGHTSRRRLQSPPPGSRGAGSRRRILTEVATHLSNAEGFALLGTYLSVTWLLRLMPASYYDRLSPVNWWHVLMQLLIADALQWAAHRAEHIVMYAATHKPHHGWVSPKLTDAFSGSMWDTIFMILFPLFVTAHLVHTNTWSYIAFGTIYGNYLCLIHCEYQHVWDDFFRVIGVATAADHHVHHRVPSWNYGHIFTYWDRLTRTYRHPADVSALEVY
eukprot:TRINITY_DN45416_c0_g1_i1.p1 TRINITY_DN45416_c0_g1~~TRINITY_DN45416_c0_g1_i1.p1  ORF type:complete len:1431 (-),score=131.98 TRINITY_DN45416_c0_g1_i1:361-4653(-)